MQRKGMQGDRDGRVNAERGATQPAAGQPRADDDDEDELQEPENAPSFLTARELQSPDPGKSPHPGASSDPGQSPEDDDAEDGGEHMAKKERGKRKSG